MPNLMDLNTPSNAELIQAALREENSINLYPEDKREKTYSETLFEAYDKYQKGADELAQVNRNRATFLENVKNELLTLSLFHEFVEPVLENFTATTHEKNVGYQTVSNFVNEQGADNLLNNFKYKNLYLAEVAYAVNKFYESINEAVAEKIKEGLPEDDIYEIEDREIEDYLLDLDDKIPKDITAIITKRVQNAVDDFIDDKKKSQFEIKQIYEKARDKVAAHNQLQDELSGLINNQTDASSDGMDPEVGINDNLNAKLDAQNQDTMGNMAGYNPTPQQEATAWANSEIAKILENNYNVFDAMTRILVESVHKIPSLNESYHKESKLDSQKIFNDVRAMYTVLEMCNTLNIIKVDEEYLGKMIKDMKGSN
jgi:hypothetical protein